MQQNTLLLSLLMRKIFLLSSILLYIFCLSQQTTKKLIFVQQVFRHGARYPSSPNKKDGSNITIIDHALGELTNPGKSQQYLLGKKLYETYWEPLFGSSNKYQQQKFYFKSTNANRTIQSLQSQLLGIFEKTETLQIAQSEINFSLPAWNSNFTRKAGNLYDDASALYHPFPIHVEKGQNTPWTAGDFLLTFEDEFCYKQAEWIAANKRDAYIIQITQNKNFVESIDALGQVLNDDLTFYDVNQYCDNAISLTYLGKKPLPIFTGNTRTAQDLNTMMILQGYMRMFHTQQQLRPISTPIFNQTINHIKRVTQNQSGVQWAFYSAHDTTIQTIISRMGLTSVECIYQNYLNSTFKDNQTEYCIVQYPTFSSQIIFEVYQYSNKTNTFQIRYNGNYRRIPFCGWQWECDVEELYTWYDSWKDQSWIHTCGVNNKAAETYFSIIIVELGVIIVFLVSAVLRYLNNKPKVDKISKQGKAAVDEDYQKTGKDFRESLISDEQPNQ